MGREIEKILLQRNHSIDIIIDKENISEFDSFEFRSAEVAIEFTGPQSAAANILKCFDANIPVVTGSTGWHHQLEYISVICLEKKQSLFYASNFSPGVNILFEVNRHLSEIMNHFSDYNVVIEEIHHVHKLDSPSGTAITLANDIVMNLERKNGWVNNLPVKDNEVFIRSVRENEITGEHTIKYDSSVDCIEIKHSAKSRKGFALGAVMAAEFLAGKKGIYTMKDLLKFSGFTK